MKKDYFKTEYLVLFGIFKKSTLYDGFSIYKIPIYTVWSLFFIPIFKKWVNK
jgi:hypothetical protein